MSWTKEVNEDVKKYLDNTTTKEELKSLENSLASSLDGNEIQYIRLTKSLSMVTDLVGRNVKEINEIKKMIHLITDTMSSSMKPLTTLTERITSLEKEAHKRGL